MQEENPYAKYRNQAQPVPVQSLQPIVGAVTPEEQARKAREEQRDVTRLDVTLEGENRAASKDQFERLTTYRKEFLTEPVVREFRTVQNATNQILELAKKESDQPGPGDISLVFSFMKALDPGSVVRESEFATAENAGGVPETVRNAYNKLINGGRLTPDIKREFAQTATTIYNSRLSSYNSYAQDYRGLVSAEGADPDAQGIRLAEPITFNPESPLTPTGEQRTEISGTSDTFLTPQDQALQSELSAAYAAGASFAELKAIADKYNRQLPFGSQQELDAGRSQGRAINVEPTGQRTEAAKAIGAAADSPVGALFIGASNAILSGAMDELAPLLGGDAATAQAAKEYMRDKYPVSSFAGEVAGQAGQLAVGGVGLRAVGAGARTLAGAEIAQGALYGAGESNDNRLGGALIAAGGAVVGQQVAQRLLNPAAKAIIERIAGETGAPVEVVEQAVTEAFEGAARQAPAPAPVINDLTTPQGGSRVIPDAPDVIATGRAENVPVLTSDVRPARTWAGNWLQSTGEKLPIVGTGGIRAGQQEARVGMVERLADEYASNPSTIDDVTADFMKTRGGEIARLTQQKRDVFSSIAGAPAPVPQASLDALDLAIGRFGQQETYRPLVARIQGWRNDLASARSINDIEDLRKAIGDTFNDDSMKSSSSALRGIVNGPDGLYAAIKKDMGGYIKDNAGEQGFAKWASSNAKLADFADDLEKGTLDRVLKRGEATPEEAASLLFSRKPSDVKALFRNLSPDGQKRARSLVVQKLVDDAGGLNELSTAKFRTALAKSKDTIGVVFPKDEAERLTGVLRLLQATKRAEQASVTTPTGQSTLPFVGVGGLGFLAGDWFGAAGVGTATAAGFRLYESKAMRNLLTELSKTKPGSAAESNILANIAKVTAKSGAPVAATTQTRPEEQPTSVIEVR